VRASTPCGVRACRRPHVRQRTRAALRSHACMHAPPQRRHHATERARPRAGSTRRRASGPPRRSGRRPQRCWAAVLCAFLGDRRLRRQRRAAAAASRPQRAQRDAADRGGYAAAGSKARRAWRGAAQLSRHFSHIHMCRLGCDALLLCARLRVVARPCCRRTRVVGRRRGVITKTRHRGSCLFARSIPLTASSSPAAAL
jgi:hypothetical protein